MYEAYEASMPYDISMVKRPSPPNGIDPAGDPVDSTTRNRTQCHSNLDNFEHFTSAIVTLPQALTRSQLFIIILFGRFKHSLAMRLSIFSMTLNQMLFSLPTS